jgi:DNA-binding NarL/FixJ family response regulator
VSPTNPANTASPAGPTRILVADDQPDVRSGFRMVLDAQPDMEVVGEAADGAAALDQARALRPDLVLADIRMPRIDGLELTRILAGPGVAEPTRVVVVTTFDLDEYVHGALANGACGFLLKRSGPTLLVEAVRAAIAGDTLISPQVTVRLLRQLSDLPAPAPAAPVAPATPGDGALSPREIEVARLVAQGATNREIARALFLSAGTVKNYVASLQRKLGTRNRVGIAVWAWSTGQVPTSG